MQHREISPFFADDRHARFAAASAALSTLTVIVPALNAARFLPACLDAIGSGCTIVVVDGGSIDRTRDIAEQHGAIVVAGKRGRGAQLIAGAAQATTDWLLFLHADTLLDADWRRESTAFMGDPANAWRAAAFRFALDDGSRQARRLERAVQWRCRVLALPYGDQGLLIHRALYDSIGGFRPLPLMEDVDLVRRLGRARLTSIHTRAVTSAEKWRRSGWIRRSARNLLCLGMFMLGVPARYLVKVYGR